MGGPVSSDLRMRVLKASECGLSARKCADRFGIAASTAIRWIDRASKSETGPRQMGGTRTSRLDAHSDFVVAMIEAQKDITLDEMVVRLADERNVAIGRSMLNKWLHSRGFTYKKDRACIGAGAPGPREEAPGLVRQLARPRSCQARLHRRNRSQHQDDTAARTFADRVSAAGLAFHMVIGRQRRSPVPCAFQA